MQYVKEWESVYHELLSINNTFRFLTNSNLGSSEVSVHHELAGNFSRIYNNDVQAVLEFVKARGNPYNSSSKTNSLKFVTEEVIPRPAAERLVNIYDHGKQADLQFRTDPFIKRTAGLSAPIKKARIKPSFSSLKKCAFDKGTPLSISAKQVSTSNKRVEIARSRSIPLSDILQYNIFDSNPLFDNNGYIKKPRKHELVTILEEKLTNE